MSTLRRAKDITGLEVTLSNENVLESFNEGVRLIVSTYGDWLTPIKKSFEKDRDFLFAQLLIGCKLAHDPPAAISKAVTVAKELIGKVKNWESYTWREQQYLEVFKASVSTDIPKYQSVLCSILTRHPTDAIALRIMVILCIRIGTYELLRDTLARVLPFWDKKKESEFYPHVLSFYSFGLEETNYRSEAEALCLRCLSLQPKCPWATHCFAHVVEESKDPKEGVDFLLRTRKDWEDSGLGNHITWHLALHYLDLGDVDKVLEEYDNVMQERAVPENAFGLVDASSLLWRLEIAGHSPGVERWSKVEEAFKQHANLRGSPFLDLHIMLSFCHDRANEPTAKVALAEEIIKAMNVYAAEGEGFARETTKKLSVPVSLALVEFSKQNYDNVLSLLLPLRYDWVGIGGSWAQRQVLFVTVIESAIQGKNFTVALQLISELKALKPKSKRLPILFEKVQKLVSQ